MSTQIWYASPNDADTRKVVTYDRVAIGAKETLELLRDAEEIANERAVHPSVDSSRLLVLIDGPAALFADETHGLLVQARAQSLTRNGRRNGVRLEVRW